MACRPSSDHLFIYNNKTKQKHNNNMQAERSLYAFVLFSQYCLARVFVPPENGATRYIWQLILLAAKQPLHRSELAFLRMAALFGFFFMLASVSLCRALVAFMLFS
jgi:hypothetical protein